MVCYPLMFQQTFSFRSDECDIGGGKLTPEDCMAYPASSRSSQMLCDAYQPSCTSSGASSRSGRR